MVTKIHRKLVFMYKTDSPSNAQRVEMGFSTKELLEPLEDSCLRLNLEIAKLVDHATFHIVEVREYR